MMTVSKGVSLLCALILSVWLPSELQASPVVLDDFSDAGNWELILADGVQGEIVEQDGKLRLDYDFTAGAGYCVLRKVFAHTMDANYRFGLRYRGEGPPNTLEFKLLDQRMENVWWSVQRDFSFPQDWDTRSMRQRHFSFAWGTSGGAEIDELGAIEIALTATQGGRGSVWFDELSYETLPEIEPLPVEPVASADEIGQIGKLGADGLIDWRAQDYDTLELSFEQPVEFSGISMRWEDVERDGQYIISTSLDGEHFRQLTRERIADHGTAQVLLAEQEARIVRLQFMGSSARLSMIEFAPVTQFPDANAYFQWMSDLAERGSYPKYFDTLSAWTVVGLPDHPHEALMSETGAVEPRKAGYTLEPFILRDGETLSWADAECTQSLQDGALPIPSVRWTLGELTLDITAVVTDRDGPERLLVSYKVSNNGNSTQDLSLVLAARPLQVLPAAQFLNTIGGAAFAEHASVDPTSISLDGNVFMGTSTPADRVLTHTESQGAMTLGMPSEQHWSSESVDSLGQFPSGALRWDIKLGVGASQAVEVALPMGDTGMVHFGDHDFSLSLAYERDRWAKLLHRFQLQVPESEAELRETIRANLAYILINADGPGIRPGSRSYERSWIRDGAMTSAALIALGNQNEARAFIDWYSEYQYANGKIPCVVDSRGPDPVDENDAPGQYLFAIRNIAEAGGAFDQAFARAMYPSVVKTVEYIEMMRDQRRTPEYTDSSDQLMRARAGLMPESISHEGYSAKPMHSYWDDFWVYRGLRDAQQIAERLGEADDSAEIGRLAEQFGYSISESIDLATQAHGISYVPGCVELGDFDATSTSIAYYLTGAAEVIDQDLLHNTFERAWESTQARIDGTDLWDGMTPYEVRTVGTFVRLGWIKRAHEYMDWLMTLQAPRGWHQWGEIAYREDAPCRFVGDMPHTWVGSGAILSILSMFSYEDGDELVLAAGIPAEWYETGEVLGIQDLVTRFGTLSYALEREDDVLRLRIEPGCTPPAGFRVRVDQIEASEIRVDGKTVHQRSNGFVWVDQGTRVVEWVD